MQLSDLISEYEYTCGSYITIPDGPLHNEVHVRLAVTRTTLAEPTFYSYA